MNEQSEKEKIEGIAYHFEQIMKILNLDTENESLKGTPKRIAKMYVNEMFVGLNPQKKPRIEVFKNDYSYSKMIISKNIQLNSACEHHFLPIIGKIHIAYIPNNNFVIGLSKIHRLVNYIARKPQVQERLNLEILEELKQVLQTEDIIVYIDAIHTCVSTRGVMDNSSTTITYEYSGKFKLECFMQEFLNSVIK